MKGTGDLSEKGSPSGATAPSRTAPGGASDRDAVVVAESAWVLVLFWVGCGAVVGWLAPLLADWLVTLRWAPLKGPAELLSSIAEPGRTIGAVGVGALLGLGLGFLVVHESLAVSVSRGRVVLTVRDASQEFGRDEVALVVRDGKQLVLLGPDGMEIAREDCHLSWQRLSDAFGGQGYRWSDEDPHREEFRRWVPGMPGLPDGADALLRARAAAREKDGSSEDVRELRRELLRLGVVVRDEGKRQYWRMPQGSPRRMPQDSQDSRGSQGS